MCFPLCVCDKSGKGWQGKVSHPLQLMNVIGKQHVCVLCSWNNFTAGFAVGGLSGVAWAYICTQVSLGVSAGPVVWRDQGQRLFSSQFAESR